MKKLSLQATALILILGASYAAFSSPKKVVVDERGKISGVVNEVRHSIQGRRFWERQSILVQKELDWQLGEPARNAASEKEIQEMKAELERDMRDFYTQYPDAAPSPAQRQADFLREQADALEEAEFAREMEAYRTKRIAELRIIQQNIALKLQ